jgi:hypothetical protein
MTRIEDAKFKFPAKTSTRIYGDENVVKSHYVRGWWVLHISSCRVGLVDDSSQLGDKHGTYLIQFGAGGPFERVPYGSIILASKQQVADKEDT